MQVLLWVAFFLVCNVLGIEAFKAAVTLPLDEALLPGVLTVPLIGLTAFGATRVADAWNFSRSGSYNSAWWHSLCSDVQRVWRRVRRW